MWRDVGTAGRTRRPQVVLAPVEHSGFDDGERCGVRGGRAQAGKGRATAGRGSRLSDAEGARRLRPFGKGRAARETGDRGYELENDVLCFVISHPKRVCSADAVLVCMDRAPMKKPIRVGGRQPVPSRAEKADLKPGRRSRTRCKPARLSGPKSPYLQGRVVASDLRAGDRMAPTIFVGIDVSKDTLDIAVRPSALRWQLANDDAGIRDLVSRLAELSATLVVLEATGGYEHPAAAALAGAGAGVVIANPRQIRDFARATGQLAKTDAIDAGILALFAERVRPEPRALPDEARQMLEALVTRRRQVTEMLVAEKNRLGHARRPVRRGITAHIRWLERQLSDVDRDLDEAIRQSPLWRSQDDLFQSVPGVGPITSRTLLAQLPELGLLDRKEIAAL